MGKSALYAGSLLVLGGLASSPISPAQQTEGHTQSSAGAPAFTLHTNVRQVLLDVTVTDKDGNPVTNLTRDDFRVEEDQRVQRVLSFDAHDFDTQANMQAAPPPPRAANTFIDLPSTPERGPLNVIFYDVVNIPPEDQMYARGQLTKFIQNKPEGARFAVFVSAGGPRLIRGFTADTAELLAAVDPKAAHPRMKALELMGQNLGGGNAGGSFDKLSAVSSLNHIARYLGNFPGRKNLFWMASGFPVSMTANSYDLGVYEAQIKRAIDLLATSRIAVFTIDTQGVVIAEGREPDGGAGSTGGSGSIGGGHTGGASLTQENYDAQSQLAQITGGKAYYSNNDMTGMLERAVRLAGSYYTLSYAPTNKNYDGKLRAISVHLDREGCRLSYRRGYYGADVGDAALPPSRNADDPAAAGDQGDVTLEANMIHGAPALHQLIFGAKVRTLGPPAMATPEQMTKLLTKDAFNRNRGKTGQPSKAPAPPPVKLQSYAIDFVITSRQFANETSEIQIAAAGYDLDGNLLNASASIETQLGPAAAGKVTGAAGNAAKGAYRMEQRIDLPMDARFLRIAVRDPMADRTGAIEISLPLAPELAPGSQVAQSH